MANIRLEFGKRYSRTLRQCARNYIFSSFEVCSLILTSSGKNGDLLLLVFIFPPWLAGHQMDHISLQQMPSMVCSVLQLSLAETTGAQTYPWLAMNCLLK